MAVSGYNPKQQLRGCKPKAIFVRIAWFQLRDPHVGFMVEFEKGVKEMAQPTQAHLWQGWWL